MALQLDSITVEQVAPWLPPGIDLTSEDVYGQVQQAVLVAGLRLAVRVPSAQPRLDAGELAEPLVLGAIAEVVARPLLNPDPGVRSSTTTTGPFSATVTRVQGSDRVTWLPSDLAPLLPPAPALGVLGTARVGVEPWRVPG